MKIKADLLHAAIQFKATNDVRHYLNGIHFKEGFIESTNGHVAVQLKSDHEHTEEFPTGTIIEFKKKVVPLKVDMIDLSKDESGNVIAKWFDFTGKMIGVDYGELVEGKKFPDFDRILTPENSGELPTINCEYYGLIPKAFRGKFLPCKLISSNKTQGNIFEIKTIDATHTVIIMPMRD